MYALIHSIQSVVAFLGPVVHTAVFTATVRTLNSAVFVMSGLLLLVPLVLLGYLGLLYYAHKLYAQRINIKWRAWL